MTTIVVNPLKGSNLNNEVGLPASLKLLPDGERPSPGQHIFRIMTAKDGDKRVVWDSRDLDQIVDAKTMFDECVEQGLVPYRVGFDGQTTPEVMDEFDPSCEEVVFLPISKKLGLLVGG
jgi:hypothetical protein